MTKKPEKLYLVDGSSYIFRAYYAIRPLSNSKGLPTNALYGFTRMLLRLVKDEAPDKMAVVFDTVEPTFRDELYKEYKANRKEPPSDLVPQFQYFGPIVEALNIKMIAMPGFEADDVIGTVAVEAAAKGYEVVIITGDKDFMQLIGENIKIYDTMKEKWIDRQEVKKKFGVAPEKVVDVMSLIGDTSDNIPGVSGIGDKSAVALIEQFKTLEDLLANIDKVSNVKSREALKEGIEKARLSKQLATIKVDVPLKYEWGEFDLPGPDAAKMKKIFSELEFFKLLRELLPEEDGEDSSECRLVTKKDALAQLAGDIKSAGSVALSFLEGTSGEGGSFFGIGLCWKKDGLAYIPMAHETLEAAANVNEVLIKEFLNELSGCKKFLYDAKGVIKKLKKRGIDIEENMSDVRLMSYLLDPAHPQDLTTLAQQELGIHVASQKSSFLVDTTQAKPQGQKISKAKGGRGERQVSVKDAQKQAGRFADMIFQLAGRFTEELSKNAELSKLFSGLEMPLIDVLIKMEDNGIKIDVAQLKVLSKEYGKKISALEDDIYKLAGGKFLIGSPKQLGQVLFEKLHLPSAKKTKTGYSTDAMVLAQLAEKYELPKLILKYRSLTKLKSTYIDALPLIMDKKTGRLHTTFNQAVTATGRLSSSDPNLQNVPARTDEGQRIRRAFIAEEGRKLMSADYSQIELRILAHVSKEKALIDAFEKGLDIHSATAAKVFNVSVAKVTGEMRAAAKTVNFGVLYGQGAYGLSKQLDIDVAKAEAYIKNYYESYPDVKKLKEKILNEAAEKGYVETLFGRRRYVPDIKSGNQQVKAFAERTAFNAVFQGTAADIIKMAMLEVDKVLKEKFPDTLMLLQVHDELVFEIPPRDADKLSKIICEKMCGVVSFVVPMEVNIGIGDNWADCV